MNGLLKNDLSISILFLHKNITVKFSQSPHNYIWTGINPVLQRNCATKIFTLHQNSYKPSQDLERRTLSVQRLVRSFGTDTHTQRSCYFIIYKRLRTQKALGAFKVGGRIINPPLFSILVLKRKSNISVQRFARSFATDKKKLTTLYNRILIYLLV